MNYKWKLDNYCDFSTFEINRLSPRNYFIPYPDKKSADGIGIKEYRYKSPLVRILNGDWDFKFYPNPNDFPVEADVEDIDWDTIDVPSCIQMRGYDIPFYTNVHYQFPCNPPKIPTNKKVKPCFGINVSNPTKIHPEIYRPKNVYNFISAYRRKFDIDSLEKDYILRFFGVSNNFDLFINGKFVGYGEGSHNSSEFLINEYLAHGENEIVLVMHRWCNGTYLEDQDMFRCNGIFRDVVLYEQEKTRIWDFDFETRRIEDGYLFALDVETINGEGAALHVSLTGHGFAFDRVIEATNGKLDGEIKDVKEWNAEEPNLYLLEIELVKDGKVIEYVKKNVGFKTVEIKGDIYYFNNKNVKWKGVNHHDTDPKNGYTMTPEDIDRDLRVMKEYGINSIRTSHYPPDPLLIELADIYGFYVCAENDLETHGVGGMADSGNGKITNNLKWAPHILDRIKRLYNTFKSSPSIALWSLGNECGGMKCHYESIKYLKERTDIPVHLESAIHKKDVHVDVTSMMYPSIPLIHGVGSKTLKKNSHNKKMMEVPFFMCEYAHAMGVGPGCLEEYFDEVLEYDSLMGGCIWEFVDHAIYHEDGPIKYTYGGDHGEYLHDGNFCCDGLFYPDRAPSTGARNMKYVYRPLRFKYLGEGKIEVWNTNSFSSASRYDISYNIEVNGVKGSDISLELNTSAWSKEEISLDIPTTGDVFINLRYVDKNDDKVSFEEQLIISREMPSVEVADSDVELKDEDGKKVITYKDGELSFDLKTGGISSYKYKDVQMVKAPALHSIARTKMDNDAYEAIWWNISGFYKAQPKLRSIKARKDGNTVLIDVKTSIHGVKIIDNYVIHGDGSIEVTSTQAKGGNKLLPRFSNIFALEDDMQNVTYLARKEESYCDIENHTGIGEFSSQVKDMIEPNLRPQESGNRTEARFVEVTNGKTGLRFTAVESPFEFSIKPISDKDLRVASHREDVEKCHESYLTISGFNMGVGTGICGPVALPKYRRTTKESFTYKYIIQPVEK